MFEGAVGTKLAAAGMVVDDNEWLMMRSYMGVMSRWSRKSRANAGSVAPVGEVPAAPPEAPAAGAFSRSHEKAKMRARDSGNELVKARGDRGPRAARWLSRRQAAQLLGISEIEVSKLDGSSLHPTRDPDRSWRYDIAEVRALLHRGRGSSGSPGGEGEIAAAAFSLFEAATSLPKVVIAIKAPAAAVVELRREYDEMVGGVHLPAGAVKALAAIVEAPIETADGLVAAVQRALATRYSQGVDEGRQEAADDFGEVIDPTTGERRRITGPKSRQL